MEVNDCLIEHLWIMLAYGLIVQHPYLYLSPTVELCFSCVESRVDTLIYSFSAWVLF